MKDFFISYNRADKQWAEWMSWTLEEADYSVVIQAWDFRPGGNFILDMQRAAAESQKTIAVLSESYLKASYTQPEWAAAFANDPQSLERKLIPVRVKECKPEGLLQSIVYVDLVGVSEATAKQTLLDSLRQRAKPEQKPAFPGTGGHGEVVASEQVITEPKAFPNALSQVQQAIEKGLQTRLDNLLSEYKALNQQLSNTSDAVERIKRERQLEEIVQEMNKVEAKLNALGA